MSLIGCVSRWFNRKGYGFIKVMNKDSEYFDQDIFVHLSNIKVDGQMFITLYPGEYVSFDVSVINDKTNCVNVRGVLGGKLLVEHEKFRYKYFNKHNIVEDNSRDEKQEQEEQQETTDKQD
jgi:cold shock CspA family protein